MRFTRSFCSAAVTCNFNCAPRSFGTMTSAWLSRLPSMISPVEVLSSASCQCREGSSWGRFRTGWLMWSRGRPGSARLLLLVTSVRSPADSRVVASEVIGQPGEPHIATSTGQRSATLRRRHGLRPFRAWVAPSGWSVMSFAVQHPIPARREPCDVADHFVARIGDGISAESRVVRRAAR